MSVRLKFGKTTHWLKAYDIEATSANLSEVPTGYFLLSPSLCVFLARRREVFFIRRFRRLSQIMAACLVAARQVTPPDVFWPHAKARRFLSADFAYCRRLWRPVLSLHAKPRRRVFFCLTRGAKVFLSADLAA